MEQVVTIVEQRLEGPVTETIIQEFTEQEALAKQQFEAARGLRSRIAHIRVTRDNSQVIVGGMLALNQVLENLS
jgi:excinuclease UvrABC nuclease subunit